MEKSTGTIVDARNLVNVRVYGKYNELVTWDLFGMYDMGFIYSLAISRTDEDWRYLNHT